MKKKFSFILLFISAFILSSCSSFNNEKVNYFSIQLPGNSTFAKEKIKENTEIKVMPFNTKGPYDTKMVFTQPPNSIFFDNYNCWALPPAEMLTNYFSLLLASSTASKGNSPPLEYFLNGTVLTFDGSLNKKAASLNINLELKNKSGKIILNKMYNKTIKMKKLSASAFAEAMTKAVNEAAVELIKDINNKIK